MLVFPRNVAADSLDLWASNLVLALLRSGAESSKQLNCGVARFEVRDGVMKTREAFLDTTDIIVRAAGRHRSTERLFGGRPAQRLSCYDVPMVLRRDLRAVEVADRRALSCGRHRHLLSRDGLGAAGRSGTGRQTVRPETIVARAPRCCGPELARYRWVPRPILIHHRAEHGHEH